MNGSHKTREYGLYDAPKIVKANLSANIVSTLQAGCFFGSLFSGYIADKFGRKPALLMAAGFACIGVIMQCAATGNLPVMYVGR